MNSMFNVWFWYVGFLVVQIFSSHNVQFCHGHRTISPDMLDSREVSEHIHSICEEGVPNESMSNKHLNKLQTCWFLSLFHIHLWKHHDQIKNLTAKKCKEVSVVLVLEVDSEGVHQGVALLLHLLDHLGPALAAGQVLHEAALQGEPDGPGAVEEQGLSNKAECHPLIEGVEHL